jgi:serine protease Do
VPAGWLGLDVQAIGADIGTALGVHGGVVVTWVDPQGPAADEIHVMDVVDAIDGRPVDNLETWRARTARLEEGASVVLGVRKGNSGREVRLTAVAAARAPVGRPLGLTLRSIPGVGAQVVGVAAGSEAERSGLRVGDIITAAGDIRMPTPAQLLRLLDSPPGDRPIPLAVTRGETHQLLALEKTWSSASR